jgi:predicted nucleic acid-binding protein
LNVLVDTNVWLDIILHREPHVTASAQAVALLDQPPHRPFLVATSLTTLFYLIRRARTVEEARRATSTLLTRVGVVTRNPRDFDPSVLPVYTPSELTAALLSQQ